LLEVTGELAQVVKLRAADHRLKAPKQLLGAAVAIGTHQSTFPRTLVALMFARA
jgi:hypothetical protein